MADFNMLRLTKLTILLWVVKYAGCSFPPGIIRDYFIYKNTLTVTAFVCSSSDSRSLAKTMSTGKLLVNIIYPGNLHYEKGKHIRLISGHATLGIFLEFDCEGNREVFFKMSESLALNASFNFLIWSSKPPHDMEGANLNIDSEVTWATREGSTGSIALYDLYKTHYAGQVIMHVAGKWDAEVGLEYQLSGFKYSRRADLQGVQLSAAVVLTTSFEGSIEKALRSTENRYMDSNAKYNYALNQYLANKFNYTLQLHATSMEGQPDEAGNFNGMLGMLQRREIEFAINSLIMRPERLDGADFTGPTWEFRTAFVFRHPLTIGKSDSLLRPFTRKAWVVIFFSWLVLTVAFQFVNWLEYRRQELKQYNADLAWSASLLTTSGAITEQGAEMESLWMTWRILYLALLLQTLLLNSFYGACLVSDLLQPPPKSILTLQEFINSKFKLGQVDNAHNKRLFKEMSDPAVKELFNKKTKSATISALDFDTAIKRMQTEEFAVHDEDIALYPVIEETFNNDDKCAITEVPIFSTMMTYGVIQKRSPYRKLITYGLRQMYENGVMARELRTWRPSPPKCLHLDKFYKVKMETVSVAFAIFICGLVSAAAILILERVLNCRQCSKKKDA